MGRGNQPGEFELVVLLSLASANSEAAGGDVYEILVNTTGREVSMAAVYITLTRMEGKGWVAGRSEAPPAGEGGKPRRFFSLTPEGAQALRFLRSQYDRLWEGARTHPGLSGE
jgi:DNA-binding PadR family transcriptional regulator